METEFKLEIVSPEESFFSNEKVKEVVVPAFEGEMGILKDHISIISFLKPGIIKVVSKDGEESFYVDDGIMEFKNNLLSILSSSIFNTKKIDKNFVETSIKNAENNLAIKELSDQNRFLENEKIEVLKSISSN